MAFTVTLYHFAKKKNSTLQPSGSGVELNCELKQPTSYKNPIFTFFVEDGFSWNYLQWDDWYYFITDVVSVRNDLFEVHCKLDVLATYKTEIGATSAFVLYDTTANTEIVDSRLSQITTATFANSDGASTMFEAGTCVLLGIVGKTSAGIWAVSEATAKGLLDSIDDWLDDIHIEAPTDGFSFDSVEAGLESLMDVGTEAVRQLISTGNAQNSIRSALRLPISADRFPGSSGRIYLGNYDTKLSGKLLSGTMNATEVFSIAIPWQATDWRRQSPYHEIYLYLPYAGLVSLPPSELVGNASLSVTLRVACNGMVVYNVSAGGKFIGRYSGNCASSYMIGRSNINPLSAMGAIGAGVGAGAGVLAAASGAAAVAVGAAGILGMLMQSKPLPSSIGTGGGGAFTDGYIPQCFTIYHNTNVDPSSVAAAIGTPTMAVKTIGTLSGFVQTREASVNASCYEDVRTEINNLMDGGFFYE